MGATIALAFTSRSRDFGDFVTGLYVWEGSSSDPITRSSTATLQARDRLGGIPVLWWRIGISGESPENAPLIEALGYTQAKALEATEFDQRSGLPLAPKPVPSATFRVREEQLGLVSHTKHLGLLGAQRFPIDAPLARFLTLSGTLSVIIETPSHSWVATFTSDERTPRLVFHDGIISMKSFDSVVRRSAQWSPGGLGNVSLLAGWDDQPDHHTRTYISTPADHDLPDRLKYLGECIACAAPAKSSEHCVPRWIAEAQNSLAVTSDLFCVDCNKFFGASLELPISSYFRAGTLADKVTSHVFALWAVKTALTISTAADVSVRDEWMTTIRAGNVPKGFQIFVSTQVRMEQGYQFSVTHFSRAARRTGMFLFSWAMDGLLFLVLHNPTGVLELEGLARIRPPGPTHGMAGAIDAVKLHDHVTELMTGHRIYRSHT